MRNTFSQEEIAWLKENYPRDESREETYARYIEAFGTKRTINGMVSYCKRHAINKPYGKFKVGHVPWTSGLSKEELKSHFSEESFAIMVASHKRNFPHAKTHAELNVPNGYVASDLGNGEKLVMREDIYDALRAQDLIGQGDFTKAAYETYLVKRKIEKMTGKRVRRLTERNSTEYLRKLGRNAVAKRKIRIVAEKGGVRREFTSLTEASAELGIALSLISRTLNGKHKQAHGWRFYKEEEK